MNEKIKALVEAVRRLATNVKNGLLVNDGEGIDAEPLAWTVVKFDGDQTSIPWDGKFDPDRLPGEPEPVEIVKGGRNTPTTRWTPDGIQIASSTTTEENEE